MALYQTFMVAISFLYLLSIPPHFCLVSTSKETRGFSLKMIHRDSPESPLYPGDNLTFHEKMSRYAKWSDARASYFVTKKATTIDGILRPPVYPDGYFYMVKFGIGTPKQEVMLLVDTGADLTWTQCEPCESCYQQKYAIYDSRKSESFEPLQCSHPLCSDILECEAGVCWYHLYYGGGPRSSGLAMNESLSFVTTDGVGLVIKNAIIGCSKENLNFEFDRTGNIGGIFGLNPSPHSLVSQLDFEFHRKFSYCLSPDPTQSTYLRFGDDIVVKPSPIPMQSTPIVRISDIHYYGLNLIDISIGNIALGFPPGTFAPKEGDTGGCFIDSGAACMLIEAAAFDLFVAAFENFFAPTEVKRNRVDCTDDTIYCYYSEGIRHFPQIKLHFEGGAVYPLMPGNYIQVDHTGTYFVFMFRPAGRTIIGAWQQHDMRIIYDVNEGNLLFAPEDCSRDG